MSAHATAGGAKRLLTTVREHVSNAVVGGLILMLTGFTPEHWVARVLDVIHLPADSLRSMSLGLDPRLLLVFFGVAIIVGDQLLRRRAVAAATAAAKPPPAVPAPAPVTAATPALPDRPSIAVLPFQNMSGEPAQDYFADGMAEEITTALSRFHWLFVIARNSSFTYKGRAVDVKQVGRELGVRYVLEGSVRNAAGRIRITVQLIDGASGAHLWADRFDGALEDIFDLQDRVSSSVVGAIAPKMQQAEIERAKRKPTESLDAYDYYLRGLACNLWLRQANDEARHLFYKAIELDPNFASAYAMAAACYVQRKANGWMADRAQEVAEAARLARRAAELGSDDPTALAEGGYALAFVADDLDSAAAMIDRALVLNPNIGTAWYLSGFVNLYLGKPEAAIEHLARAMRMSPLDPLIFAMHAATGYAHFLAGRYKEALPWVEKALQENPNHSLPNRIGAACYALAGKLQEAKKAAARLLEIDPSFRISRLKAYVPFRRQEDLDRLAEGLRAAGLPA